uniref:Uncharacterized protein n=2 Tax=Lactuca TaxID=4235 RepID=A0A9R1W2B1_LACSA|nr:hypothetical protein LSAT_V11C300151640 [Lactuca sativa]
MVEVKKKITRDHIPIIYTKDKIWLICLLFFLRDQTSKLFLREGEKPDRSVPIRLLELPEPFTMTSLGTSKGVLEIAKFAVYVTVPIGLMYFFANNTKNLHKFMGARQYVVYPPEGPRPQSPEELREMAREIARKRSTQ